LFQHIILNEVQTAEEMFYVVEFYDGSVEVVPDSWMLSASECYWPQTKGKHQIAVAIQQKKEPGNTWRIAKVKRAMRKCGMCVFNYS